MVREAAGIVRAHAEGAKNDMAARYPVRAYGSLADRGALLRGLKLEMRADDPGSTSARVKNSARHAWIFENGTGGKVRHQSNGKSTGIMPPGRVFVPIAMDHRRRMVRELVDMMRRAGFEVSGVEE